MAKQTNLHVVVNAAPFKGEGNILKKQNIPDIQGEKVAAVNPMGQKLATYVSFLNYTNVNGLSEQFIKHEGFYKEYETIFKDKKEFQYGEAAACDPGKALTNAGITKVINVVFPDAKNPKYHKKSEKKTEELTFDLYEKDLKSAYANMIDLAIGSKIDIIQTSLGGSGIFNNDVGGSKNEQGLVIPREKLAGLHAKVIKEVEEKATDLKHPITLIISTGPGPYTKLLPEALKEASVTSMLTYEPKQVESTGPKKYTERDQKPPKTYTEEGKKPKNQQFNQK